MPFPNNHIAWTDNGLVLLDQRLLPHTIEFVTLTTAPAVADAIRDMVVRGAPAIGVAAAYGVVLAVRRHLRGAGDDWRPAVDAELDHLAQARPTAVNLQWAVDHMRSVIASTPAAALVERLTAEAIRIHDDDIAANKAMGEFGAQLLPQAAHVITHCNAGALATGGHGTALGVIRSAHGAGKIGMVYSCETRPWFQGARLTMYELIADEIPATQIVDSAAAALMQSRRIDWVITGADRIARNGDVANKIGTYALAVAARAHGVKFMVAAPRSTFDQALATGADIAIEQRGEDEITTVAGHRIAATGGRVWNPVFDVTPAHLIDAIVCETGVILDPGKHGAAIP
ncbi:MAG: S-methyl-5-thioribose-1-phosphate isomerase [Gammaproteobacteria bacterium]|nr:S-methyl-5-thioribose-1-phosphate isomerase [Gammaproteobacteria bacterium]